jgi:hypothetical protein
MTTAANPKLLARLCEEKNIDDHATVLIHCLIIPTESRHCSSPIQTLEFMSVTHLVICM